MSKIVECPFVQQIIRADWSHFSVHPDTRQRLRGKGLKPRHVMATLLRKAGEGARKVFVDVPHFLSAPGLVKRLQNGMICLHDGSNSGAHRTFLCIVEVSDNLDNRPTMGSRLRP